MTDVGTYRSRDVVGGFDWRTRTKKPSRTERLVVRVGGAEREAWDRQAAAAHLTLGSWVRRILNSAQQLGLTASGAAGSPPPTDDGLAQRLERLAEENAELRAAVAALTPRKLPANVHTSAAAAAIAATPKHVHTSTSSQLPHGAVAVPPGLTVAQAVLLTMLPTQPGDGRRCTGADRVTGDKLVKLRLAVKVGEHARGGAYYCRTPEGERLAHASKRRKAVMPWDVKRRKVRK